MAMKVMNGLDLQSQKIINLADPTSNTDAANKQYVDNTARGLYWKDAVRAASTANVTLASPGTTMDGVTLAVNDRVLLMNQTAPAENGIWVWTASGSTLTRAVDADSAGELKPGTAVSVNEGTTNGDKVFHITSDAAITIGTTSQTWSALGGGTTYVGTNGVSVSGSSVTAVAAAGGGLTVTSPGIGIDTSVVARKYSANVGNGALTSIVVNHALATSDVHVSVREVSTNAGVLVDWVATDANNVTLTFAVAPASSAFRCTIIA